MGAEQRVTTSAYSGLPDTCPHTHTHCDSPWSWHLRESQIIQVAAIDFCDDISCVYASIFECSATCEEEVGGRFLRRSIFGNKKLLAGDENGGVLTFV